MVDIRTLRWDGWNVEHIRKHGVTAPEVDEICHNDPIVRRSYKSRLVLIGRKPEGEDQGIYTIVLDPEGEDVYYPLSARPASRKERRAYQDEKGGEKAA